MRENCATMVNAIDALGPTFPTSVRIPTPVLFPLLGPRRSELPPPITGA